MSNEIINNEVPLIWTTKGNVPIEQLQYSAQWFENDDFIKLVETYVLDGEIVKQNAHIKVKQGSLTNSSQGGF